MSHNFLSGFVFLVIGVVELVLVQSLVYPALRWHYEKAKLTASQGVDPQRIMNVVKLQSLVVMPVVGFLVGGYFRTMFR